jgi:CBS domain containing-hemolysin-like protein
VHLKDVLLDTGGEHCLEGYSGTTPDRHRLGLVLSTYLPLSLGLDALVVVVAAAAVVVVVMVVVVVVVVVVAVVSGVVGIIVIVHATSLPRSLARSNSLLMFRHLLRPRSFGLFGSWSRITLNQR